VELHCQNTPSAKIFQRPRAYFPRLTHSMLTRSIPTTWRRDFLLSSINVSEISYVVRRYF